MKQWLPEEIADLPRDGIFTLRGTNPTRLETFVDAAFAFAVTLLVISIDSIPDSYEDFVAALLKTPAFICCFFQLIMFWLGHRAWSRRYGMETTEVLWLSLTLVAGILIIVYPLRLMFAAGFAFVSDGYLPADINFSFHQLRTLFVLYSSGFGALSFLIALLFWLALREREALLLTELEAQATKAEVYAWLILTATGCVSVLIALFAEGLGIIWAGWVYAGLAVVMPLQAIYSGRRLSRLKNS